jgi:hypothetical protein
MSMKTMPVAIRFVCVLATSLLVIVAVRGQVCHADCHLDAACAYAVRSLPLHPATVGEALDARRAVDEACSDYRACIKREADASDAPAASINSNLNPTVQEFWKKQAEKEAAH